MRIIDQVLTAMALGTARQCGGGTGGALPDERDIVDDDRSRSEDQDVCLMASD